MAQHRRRLARFLLPPAQLVASRASFLASAINTAPGDQGRITIVTIIKNTPVVHAAKALWILCQARSRERGRTPDRTTGCAHPKIGTTVASHRHQSPRVSPRRPSLLTVSGSSRTAPGCAPPTRALFCRRPSTIFLCCHRCHPCCRPARPPAASPLHAARWRPAWRSVRACGLGSCALSARARARLARPQP